jgi:TfoX/Sxy family transcriptional regulator of competence genes
MTDVDALFGRLVARFSADPSVTPPGKGGKFGASGLKADGKLFAMLSRGELVVKLPRDRVEALVASGKGKPFDPGHGRLMKEWVTIAPDQSRQWGKLAEEAREFVAAASQRS